MKTRRPATRAVRAAFIDPFAPREIRRLVAEFGSPLLIVDCERVRRQFRQLQQALPGVDLHYALKPLPHPAVVRTVLGEGGFLDLATTGEVELVARMGVDPAHCVYVGDDERDIVAGHAAGMWTVAAHYGYLGQGVPASDWGAHADIHSPLALLKILELD